MLKLIFPLTNVDTTAAFTLGSRTADKSGNEYIYLAGCASTTVGKAVTYDYAYATTLSVADNIGPIAVALASTVADTYGWYQVKGAVTMIAAGAATAGKALYVTSTGGSVDDAVVAGDLIANAFVGTAPGGTGSTFTGYINYPFCTDTLS